MVANTTEELQSVINNGNIDEIYNFIESQKDINIRQKAIGAISRMGGDQGIKLLLKRLPDADPELKATIIDEFTKNKESQKIISTLLKDPDQQIQKGALQATIGIIGNRRKNVSKEPSKKQSILINLGAFILGIFLWGIPMILSYLVSLIDSRSDWIGYVLNIGWILMLVLAIKGMNRTFVSSDGTRLPPVIHEIYSVIALIAVSATIIGLYWTFSWTGKGALRFIFRNSV